jgi:hypothetical protein
VPSTDPVPATPSTEDPRLVQPPMPMPAAPQMAPAAPKPKPKPKPKRAAPPTKPAAKPRKRATQQVGIPIHTHFREEITNIIIITIIMMVFMIVGISITVIVQSSIKS